MHRNARTRPTPYSKPSTAIVKRDIVAEFFGIPGPQHSSLNADAVVAPLPPPRNLHRFRYDWKIVSGNWAGLKGEGATRRPPSLAWRLQRRHTVWTLSGGGEAENQEHPTKTMRSFLTCNAAIALFVSVSLRPCTACSAEELAPPETAAQQERLDFLRTKLSEFEFHEADGNQRPLTCRKQPILHWSNPVRDYVDDGYAFVYVEGQRPRAVVNVWLQSDDPTLNTGEFWREFILLRGKPLHCRRGERLLWSPKAAPLEDQTLDHAAAPAASRPLRLVQMRQLASRFQATIYKDESPNELRIMRQPLYRYQDQDAGILDGALFAFAEANDAELLLLIEAAARNNGRTHEWQYALARITSYRLVVQLDDDEIFSVEDYWKGARNIDDPYLEKKDSRYSLRDKEKNASSPE